jgi:LuxR family maltose regulon positive regulatory protein
MEHLLTTKLNIPSTRAGLVPRPRLIEQLDEGARGGCRLTLVSAPAGYGKTTLVSEWVSEISSDGSQPAQDGCSIAWLSLDEDDSDPVRFLEYLIAALNRARGSGAEVGIGALEMLQSPLPPPVEVILTNLINEISPIPGRLILVLDDYHLIDAQPVHDELNFLVEHMPENLHLVISSRDDPLLPLARLRVRGQMSELRAADLRFSAPEATDFLNQTMGLGLSDENIAALEARTEGWIAGLHLAALVLHGALSVPGRKDRNELIKSFTGSHRFVLDYLVEEILEQQPAPVQLFLLQTSILERFNSSLCNAVRFSLAEPDGNSPGSADAMGEDSQPVLEMLDRASLFIVPLDERRGWYRYHHLFSELLRQRLSQTHPEQVTTLHRRAGAWHEQHGFIDQAVEHALQAEDFQRAADLIERAAEKVWVSGADLKLRRWLDRLPGDLVCSNPQLCIFDGWYHLAAGEQETADRSLQAAELALDPKAGFPVGDETSEQEQPELISRQRLLGRIATTRAFSAFYRGDAPEIVTQAQKALQLLPENDLFWRSTAIQMLGDGYDLQGDMDSANRSRVEALQVSRVPGNSFQLMIAHLKYALVLRQQGHLERVEEICEQQLRIAGDFGIQSTVVAGWTHAIWGEVLAERDQLEQALHQAEKGVALTERGSDLAMLGWSYLCLTRVLYSRGELDRAEGTVRKIELAAQESYMPPWIMNHAAAWQARIWLAQGRVNAATQWMAERRLDPAGELAYPHEPEYIVLARILIAQGRYGDANILLDRLYQAAEAGGRTASVIMILILQALAFQASGDDDRAAAALMHALALAEAGRFVRIFVDEGPQVARLLYQALSRRMAPEYVSHLLGAFPAVEEPKTEQAPALDEDDLLLEPMSEREIEVLLLIAEGLTNPQIASRLFLSLNTVKVHTRNIYAKLDVHNRTQAVARGRALGLLPAE